MMTKRANPCTTQDNQTAGSIAVGARRADQESIPTSNSHESGTGRRRPEALAGRLLGRGQERPGHEGKPIPNLAPAMQQVVPLRAVRDLNGHNRVGLPANGN